VTQRFLRRRISKEYLEKKEKEESPPPQFLFHVFPVILEVPHAILSAANAREDASTISRKLPVPCTT
jgi:hypothetical protein